MKLPLKQRVFLSGVVIALAAVLVGLAVLQYRWAREVSDATSVRLQANLDASIQGWRDDLYRELTSVLSALQVGAGQSQRDRALQYAQQYQAWSQTATHPNLISRLFLFQDAGTDRSQLLQWNAATNQFEQVDWPTDLGQLRNWVQDHSTEFVTNVAAIRARDRDRLRRRSNGTAIPFSGHRPFPDGVPAMVDMNALALVRAQVHRTSRSSSAANDKKPQQPPVIDWVVVQLDRKVFQEHILPESVERHFSGAQGLDYQVAVANGSSVLYSTDPGFGKQDAIAFDRTMPVFGPPRGQPARRPMNPSYGPPPPRSHGNGHDRTDAAFTGLMRMDPIHYSDSDGDWQLLVRHRLGSVEAVVSGIRRRNLALSFGVLLVLAAGITIVLISTQRARALAKLQMDFVAAVSHELRTPLAVISSAAENIADGVVAGKQQLSQYGTEIKNQAKHLIQLVEQILQFSATRNKGHHYTLRPLRVADVIDTALKDTAALMEENNIILEREIAPNLPPVMGDLPALSHCLQNLITNAVKYGGDARWIRISAKAYDAHGRLDEVQISVEDKGLGIGASELRRIFEPFYRSRSATAAQIHGTGLGLALARDIAGAMGGRLTVTSQPGQGSCFTLYLRFAEVAELQTSPQTAAAVNPNLSKT